MPPAPPQQEDDVEAVVVDESSPLVTSGKDRALGEFGAKKHIFFSFLDVSEREGTPIYDTGVWRFCHALGFCIGGFFFLIGTCLYYPMMYLVYSEASDQTVNELAVWIGWLYTIGSCGFLFVDVQEFFTFTDDAMLRVNILCSAFGSTLYVIGSAGFLPSIWAITPLIGLLGFIGGSAAIGMSQTWKLVRILSSHKPPYKSSTINAAFVEGELLVLWLLLLLQARSFREHDAVVFVNTFCLFLSSHA